MGFGEVRNIIYLSVSQNLKQNAPDNLMMTCGMTFPKEQKKTKLFKIMLHLKKKSSYYNGTYYIPAFQ